MRKLKCLGMAAALLLGLAAVGLVVAASQPVAPAAVLAQETAPAWLGVQLVDLNPRLVQRLGLSRQEGVVVLRMLPQSPAAQAGLQARDVILEVNGQGVSRVGQVVQAVAQAKPGDKITLKVWRGGVERSLEVTLGTPPTPPVPPKDRRRPFPFGGFFRDRLGGLENLGERFLGGQFSFRDKEGQRVTFTVIAGTVAVVGTDRVTLTPNDGDSQTFQVTPKTGIAKGGGALPLAELRVGDQVVVVSTQAGVADVVVVWGLPPETPRPWRPWFGGHALRPLPRGGGPA